MAQADFVTSYLGKMVALMGRIPQEPLVKMLQVLEDAHAQRRRVFIVGNGGSASTASHMANDFVKGSCKYGGTPLRAISLTDCVPLMTAIANDEAYSEIFSGQLEPLAEKGDVLIAITGSGNSPNVVRALETAKKAGLTTIGLLGMGGGKCAALTDVTLIVPSQEYGPIEDVHLMVNHLVTSYFQQKQRRPATSEPRNEIMRSVP